MGGSVDLLRIRSCELVGRGSFQTPTFQLASQILETDRLKIAFAIRVHMKTKEIDPGPSVENGGFQEIFVLSQC